MSSYGRQEREGAAIISLVLLVIGLILYPFFYPEAPFVSRETAKYMVLAPEYTLKEGSWYTLSVRYIDFARNTANVTIDLVFSPFYQPSEASPLTLAIQVPGAAKNPVVVRPFGFSPYGYSARGTIKQVDNPSEGVTYFVLNFTKILPDFGDSIELELSFIWVDCMYRSSFTEFVLVVPFGFSFADDEGLEVLRTPRREILSPDRFKLGYVGLGIPSEATISSAYPESTMVSFGSGRAWMSWGLSVLSNYSVVSGSAVVVSLESTTLRQEKEIRAFVSAAIIGSAAPTLLMLVGSATYDRLRRISARAHTMNGLLVSTREVELATA
jgi:hypothetical protein